MTVRTAPCRLILAQLSLNDYSPWTFEVSAEKTTIGSGVNGRGRWPQPGVAGAHITIWKDREGAWLESVCSELVFLNSITLSPRGPVLIVKGDRVRLGNPEFESELLYLCEAELRAAQAAKDEIPNAGPEDELFWRNSDLLTLTPAEYQIVAWMGRGVVDVDGIASRLFRAVNTVRTQINRIYEKLEIHSKADLLAYLMRNRYRFESRRYPVLQFAGSCNCQASDTQV